MIFLSRIKVDKMKRQYSEPSFTPLTFFRETEKSFNKQTEFINKVCKCFRECKFDSLPFDSPYYCQENLESIICFHGHSLLSRIFIYEFGNLDCYLSKVEKFLYHFNWSYNYIKSFDYKVSSKDKGPFLSNVPKKYRFDATSNKNTIGEWLNNYVKNWSNPIFQTVVNFWLDNGFYLHNSCQEIEIFLILNCSSYFKDNAYFNDEDDFCFKYIEKSVFEIFDKPKLSVSYNDKLNLKEYSPSYTTISNFMNTLA